MKSLRYEMMREIVITILQHREMDIERVQWGGLRYAQEYQLESKRKKESEPAMVISP